ncbi:MAG: hypothetical protein ACKOBJ_07875, partial [Actinomycetota bacterium]
PMKKVGQGLLKPVSLVAKGLGYATLAIPLYKYFQNKKRKKAIEAATNRVNNRLAGRPNDQVEDGFVLANHLDENQAPAVPQYAGEEAQDGVLRALEGRKETAELNRIHLREVLGKANESYEKSTKSRAVGAALKFEGRDLRKENVSAWQDFERKHNEQQLDQQIADRKRERAKNPETGESFLEKQKRKYLEWFDKNKRFDYADANMGSVMQRFAANGPRADPPAPGEAGEPGDNEAGSLDGFQSGSEGEGDVDRVDGERSSRRSVDLDASRWAGGLDPDAEKVAADANTSEMKDAAASQGPDEEEIKQPETPQSSAAAEWFKKVPGLGPIQNDAPQEEKIPLGYTPEGWAEEKRVWEKLRKQKQDQRS